VKLHRHGERCPFGFIGERHGDMAVPLGVRVKLALEDAVWRPDGDG
jgi:hypothetical protein